MWKFNFLLNGVIGFGVGLALAYLMFYAGQWGGGDSKMLMGLGALLGLEFSFADFFFGFLINLLFVGAMYGLVWSVVLAIRRRKIFSKKAKEQLSKPEFRRLRLVVISGVALSLVVSIFLNQWQRLLLLVLAVFAYLMLYLWVFIKAVEESCMLKWVEPEELTEGDWIAKPITIGGKNICGPKDLGIRKEQIRTLIRLHQQKKVGRVLIKEGIPFVPSFLLAFIVTMIWGNMVPLFLR